jgi:NADH-quinone oxidoreductase subunit G
VCAGCAVGCNTIPGERYGRLKRVHNRFNAEVNGYFLCDRGRFGAAFVNSEKKLMYPGLREADGRYRALDHHEALSRMSETCSRGGVAGIGSPRASVEANFLLRELAGADNFAPGFSNAEQPLANQVLQLLQNSPAVVPDIPAIESADAVFILGEDVTNTAPRIALALRQSVRNKAYELAAELKLTPWQDAAIRNLAQDQRSPLYIATVADTPLDDVATGRYSLAPEQIAALGREVALGIAGDRASISAEAAAIATALASAKRPLVLAGTGCGSASVLDAADQVVRALAAAGRQVMFSLCLPEANSLGQAMLAGPGAPDLATLEQRAASGELRTLVVLENDLYRRGGSAQISRLLTAFDQVIVLDGLDNATTSAASLALPAATFTESEGTLVSMEGRAQRYFPVFQPPAERRSAWVWLLACMKEMELPVAHPLHHFDDITRACGAALPALSGIAAAAPDLHYLNLGVKIPRQPGRYSGRTAMRANISVHEPRQREDEETPLAYTMEGLNRNQPGALLPFVWSPGWNSNQSVSKFQTHPGGPLKGGTGGVRLLQPGSRSGQAPVVESCAAHTGEGPWLLVPRHRIFGSDELSAQSPALAELITPGYIELCPADAASIGVAAGDGVEVGEGLATLEVRINPTMTAGCAGFAAGLAGTHELQALRRVELRRAAAWRRAPQVIGSDRAGGGDV